MHNLNSHFHHRRSIRLKGYDYSQAGLYFITICCQDRACIFGHIENGIMQLNQYGEIAFNEWKRTPEIRPNVELDEFIIMPNHMHGIIRILDNPIGVSDIEASRKGESHSPNTHTYIGTDHLDTHTPATHMGESHSPNTHTYIGTDHLDTHNPSTHKGESHSPNAIPINNQSHNDGMIDKDKGECNSPLLKGPSNNIGAIIRGYKGAVTKQLNALHIGRAVWQRNYYEHIIRDEQSFYNIANYIQQNPLKWDQDKFYNK